MKSKIVLLTTSIALTGCAGMEAPEPAPIRPVLSCDDCSGLTYYGPQMAPAPDPRVQMAQIITGGITKVAGIVGGTYAATNIAGTIADAGKYVVGPSTTQTTTTTSTTDTVTANNAVPTIVRPEVVNPTVVNPEVVRPEVVNPEIVNPVIVTP